MTDIVDQYKRIQQTFDDFFSTNEGRDRKPSDIKEYNRSIYNVLCQKYKGQNNKIDRGIIITNFVKPKYKKKFARTKQYTDEGITKEFDNFFSYLKKNNIQEWSTNDLYDRNRSLCITLQKNNTNKECKVDRENIVTKYNLDTNKYGIVFKRKATIRKTITIEAVNNHLENIVLGGEYKYRSPRMLYESRPTYYKRLTNKFRTENNKIDRLYILYKGIVNIELIKRFRHRYSDHLGISAKNKISTSSKETNRNKINANTKNPEDLLIEKEDNKKNKDILEKMISQLSSTEKVVINDFLEEQEYDADKFAEIIQKLRKLTITNH